MESLGAGLNTPLIAVRAIHFAATAMTTGTLVFRTLVLEPALRSEQAACSGQTASDLEAQMLGVAWIGLGLTAVSGVIWMLCEAASMSGFPFSEAMTSSLLLTVLQETQFGWVWDIRLVLELILAICLACHRFAAANWLALGAGLGLAAGIAWTGHAGSTPGELGNFHVAADALHLPGLEVWCR
jgi:putative copper resistance protein D